MESIWASLKWQFIRCYHLKACYTSISSTASLTRRFSCFMVWLEWDIGVLLGPTAPDDLGWTDHPPLSQPQIHGEQHSVLMQCPLLGKLHLFTQISGAFRSHRLGILEWSNLYFAPVVAVALGRRFCILGGLGSCCVSLDLLFIFSNFLQKVLNNFYRL